MLKDLITLFENRGTITIPPGAYRVPADGRPIRLRSGQRILAHGARFILPDTLGDRARLVVFEGEDIEDLRWEGGSFEGRCFDPAAAANSWEPNVNTRGIVVRTSDSGRCRDLSFSNLAADGVAGAVISVHGRHEAGSDRSVAAFAENVTVRDCTLQNCGKFMWDYGYLWQIIGWPEEYGTAELAMARRYFPDLYIERDVRLDRSENRIVVSDPAAWKDLCLFAPGLRDAAADSRGAEAPGIVRGRRYYIAERGADWIRIAETPDGAPVDLGGLAGDVGPLDVVHDLHDAYMALYAPDGSGPGKGAVDLTACRHTMMSGNRLSARGDTMHIHSSHDNVFANNQITGSRMGAFFLSEWCKNSTITGNTVDGTNGSRVVSVEKSNEDVTIIGNTFRGGGRGSWINQPTNIIIQGNVFINNTTKCEADSRRGRRTFETGGYERRSELYFTTHEEGGAYGPVIVADNIFVTGPEAKAAVEIHGGGHDITIRGNHFAGHTAEILVDRGCQAVECDRPMTWASLG